MIRRLLIIGCPGSGKSTLAARIAAETGLPLVSLDKIYWQPNWTKPADHSWKDRLAAELSKPAWIIDGNYGATLSMRLRSADAVVMLDYSTATCLLRVIKRMVFERPVSEVALGCPERINVALIRYILQYRKEQRPKLLRELTSFSGQTFLLTSPKSFKTLQDLIS